MDMTVADRIIAGLGAAHFAYRLWSGWGDGIIAGDGDADVHADRHPFAFVLTALSMVLLTAILAYAALGPDAARRAAAAWILKI
jgi:hypothetical protein